jgi:hypothetical protein
MPNATFNLTVLVAYGTHQIVVESVKCMTVTNGMQHMLATAIANVVDVNHLQESITTFKTGFIKSPPSSCGIVYLIFHIS